MRPLALLLVFAGSAAVHPLHALVMQATPASCSAERAHAERVGLVAADLDRYAREAAVASRAAALAAIDYWKQKAAPVNEGSRAYRAFDTCLHQARLAALGAPPPASQAPTTLTIVSTQRVGTVTGNFAQSFVQEWAGATLEAPPGPNATAWLEAIAALEAGPADGSRLLLTTLPLPSARAAREVIDALARLQRVRMLAAPNTTNSGVALFAPSGTPRERVLELTEQSRAALNAPAMTAALERARYARPSANITQTLASIRQQLSGDAATAAAPGATPGPGSATTTAATWPLGIAPGNLYVIGAQLVSARSMEEALSVGNEALRFYSPYAPNARAVITKECTGPNWGAIVFHVEEMGQGKSTFGWACGATTPGDALQIAGEECKRKRGRPCSQDGNAYMKFLVGHSGEPYRSFNNSDPMWMASQLWAMGPPVNNTEMLVKSPEHAIGGLGGMCANAGGSQVPCFVTFRSYECTQYRGNGHPGCLDHAFTARGVQPLRNPIGR